MNNYSASLPESFGQTNKTLQVSRNSCLVDLEEAALDRASTQTLKPNSVAIKKPHAVCTLADSSRNS